MTRVKVFFINFLLFLTSNAKPFKASDIDSDTSHDIKVTPPELNDKESIYMKNDDILSISELSKLNNPEEHHFTDIRYIKETDNDNIKRVISKNNKTKLDIPKLEEYNQENKQDKHADTIVSNVEESKESKSEKLTTEKNEIESTTISISSVEVFEEDLEVPESGESTEGYVDIVSFNEEVSNDKLDAMEPITPSRRSLFQNDELLLDNDKSTSNKPVEIVEVNQDTVAISGLMTVKEPDQQSIIESKTGTPSVTPELPIHSDPITADQQSQILSPDLSFRRLMPVDLKEISNQENTKPKLEKMAPEYKQSNNLDKSINGDITTNNKSIEDFNSNPFENEYPFTPVKVKNINQKPLLREGNLNLLYSKLTDASEHPWRNRERAGGDNFSNSAVIHPNFNLPSRRFYNFGVNNFRPAPRRLLPCKICGHNDHKVYIY